MNVFVNGFSFAEFPQSRTCDRITRLSFYDLMNFDVALAAFVRNPI